MQSLKQKSTARLFAVVSALLAILMVSGVSWVFAQSSGEIAACVWRGRVRRLGYAEKIRCKNWEERITWGIGGAGDADADPTNELNTAVALETTILKVSDAGGTKSADLSSLQDGTGSDDQTLSFLDTTLSIEDGNSVDLSSLQNRALLPQANAQTAVDSAGEVGIHTSITVGADGLPIISYFDYSNLDLKAAHCADAACTSVDTPVTVDSVGDVGKYTSISVGADGLPIISYLAATHGDLKVAHCADVACTSVDIPVTLDSVGGVGLYNSITVGADGLPIISYTDNTNYDLKVAHCADVACMSATAVTLDSAGNVGQSASITVGADGLPIISYYDGTYQDLKVAHCADVACTSATLVTVDSAGNVGRHTSITVGAGGLPIISYVDYTNNDLKVTHCSNIFCVPFFRRR